MRIYKTQLAANDSLITPDLVRGRLFSSREKEQEKQNLPIRITRCYPRIMIKLTIYTDGACSGNPGPGGYAAIIIDESGKEVVVSGGEKNTTNNKMEMLAFIKSLEHIKQNYESTFVSLSYHIDSQYVIKGITEWMPNWKKKNWKGTSGPVKNRDLWEQIDALIKDVNITYTWVKGHNQDKYNEMADEIAVEEIERIR
jgi:ribonuclease HI